VSRAGSVFFVSSSRPCWLGGVEGLAGGLGGLAGLAV
jgi:hypothetical protein